MKCPDILNINLSGKTIIWLILIVVNFLIFIFYAVKYNPFETFSNIYNDNYFYDIFLKKLEYHSADKRNKIINQVRRPFLEEGTSHSRNNILVNNIIEDDPITESSLTNSIKSQPKPIRRHTEDNNNNNINRNDNETHFNSYGNLFGLVRSFFPQRHHERHHQRHHQIHHQRHNQRHHERHHHFHV